MGQFTDARGVCLFQSLEDELYDWAEHIPYDFPGDDGAGYAECRETYDRNLAPQVAELTYRLERESPAAMLDVRDQFAKLATQCVALDAWCTNNPAPSGYWPAATAFAAVGDPDAQIIAECYRVIQRVKAAIAPGIAAPTQKIDLPTLAIVRAIEAGKSNGAIAMELKTTPNNVAKVKNYHKNGRYVV